MYEHGEDAGAAADVEDHLVLEDVLVLDDRVHVRPRADLIFLLECAIVAQVSHLNKNKNDVLPIRKDASRLLGRGSRCKVWLP